MKRGSLSRRIALLTVLAATVPLLVFGGLAVVIARRNARAYAEQVGRELAGHGAREVRAIVDRYAQALAGVALTIASAPRVEPAAARRTLRDVRLELRAFRSFELVTPEGEPLADSRLEGEAPPRLPRELLEEAGRGRPVVGRPYPGEGLEPMVLLAHPLRWDGKVRAILVGAVQLTETWAAISTIRVGEGGHARLLGEDGFEVGHGKPEEQAAILEQHSHPGQARARPRTPDLVSSSAPVEGLGWRVVIEQPTAEAFALARLLTWLLLGLVALVGGVAALVAARIARRTTAPLQAIAQHAEGLATHVAESKVPPAIALTGATELDALVGAVNTMSAELAHAFEEARDTERQVTVARVGAGLAHDLRTPLVALGGMLKVLARSPGDAEMAREFAAQMDQELARVHRFIDRMGALARGLDPGAPPTKVPVDLVHAARRTVARLQSGGVVPEGVELVASLPAEPVELQGNPDDLERLIENLLVNAFQAMTGRSGRVEVSVTTGDGGADLVVRDQGCGIPAERIERLFKDFKSSRRGGFGIGLAMVKRVADESGLGVSVRSDGASWTELRLHSAGATR